MNSRMENNNLILQPRSNQIQDNNNDDVRSRYRPSSYYDNTLPSIEKSLPKDETNAEQKFEKNPSQVHCLATTVPQNIASQNIAGKHAPTRNSLRHSRMIVLNKSGQTSTPSVPPLVKHYKYVKTLLILITFFGAVLGVLSLLLLLWTPNIRPRDNPYWSAVPVISSGIIGFILLYILPSKRPDFKCSYWINSFKFVSIFASLIATVAAFTTCGFAVIHLMMLSTATCSPPDKVNITCLCSTDPTKPSTNSYHYIDLSCTDVNNMLYSIILFSCIINAIIGISEILYLYIHWSSRNTYTYSRVQTTQTLNKNNKGNR